MAVTPNSIVTPQTPRLGIARIVNADGSGAYKTIVTAGQAGNKITGLLVTSSDSSSRLIALAITRSATVYALLAISIPATSGTVDGVPPVNLLDPTVIPGLPIDNDGQPYFFLEANDTLQFASGSTVTSGKALAAFAVHSEF